jgi:hypothetical protein
MLHQMFDAALQNKIGGTDEDSRVDYPFTRRMYLAWTSLSAESAKLTTRASDVDL